jgi:cell division protein FtsN
MANLERGAHDADNVYAFDPNEDDDADLETSRLPLLIAIALVVLAAFAGVVWLAYTQGVEEGRADAPRIAATQTHSAPAKAAANPYAGLNIYQPPASSDAGNEPIAPIPPRQNAEGDNSQPPLRPSASTAADRPAPAAELAQTPTPKPASLSARTASKIAVPVKPKTPAPASASAAPPTQTPALATPETALSAKTAPAPSQETAAAGAMVQIGSYKSEAEARQSWTGFKARHAIAAAFGPDVKQVDLGAKGVWYRLRLGGFGDRRSAAAFCDKLKAQGASCIVSR